MATDSTLIITISFRWWLPIYLNTLALLCRVFHVEPNWTRFNFWVAKGLVLSVEPQPNHEAA